MKLVLAAFVAVSAAFADSGLEKKLEATPVDWVEMAKLIGVEKPGEALAHKIGLKIM